MRTIKIGFSKSTKKLAVLSWAIRKWEGTEFSHCYSEFENRRFADLPLVYQASHDMMNFMTKPVFESKNKVIEEFSFQISEDSYDRIMYKAMAIVGKPYGIAQAIGIVLSQVFKLNKNPFKISKDSYICSEWCATVLEELGMSLTKDRNLLTPKDVYNIIKSHQHPYSM